MAEPTQKSPGIESLISGMMGKDRTATIKANKCMTCDGEATTFSDDLSRKEYAISGMCQVCQDKTFGGE